MLTALSRDQIQLLRDSVEARCRANGRPRSPGDRTQAACILGQPEKHRGTTDEATLSIQEIGGSDSTP